MAIHNINKSDLWFTSTGDFVIDRTGDLKDTLDTADRLESAKQWVLHRVIGEAGAWRLHRRITAGLESYKGRMVDPDLLRLMSERATEALTIDGFLKQSDVVVKVIELTPGDVLIAVYLLGVQEDKPIYVMSYDLQYGAVTRIR